MTATIPAELQAGDTFTASAEESAYPATGGWSATLYLVGASAAPVSQAGVPSGAGFTFTIAAASTANIAAGTYSARILYTKAAERHTVAAGTLIVRADPSASATRLRDTMGPWGRIVLDLEAAYQDYITAGRIGVASYTINGRAMQYAGADKILAALQNARVEARRERQQAGEDVGTTSWVTRM